MAVLQQPPILRGTDTEKITRIHSYLYQVSRDLNSALNNLTEANFAPNSIAAQAMSSGTPQQKQEIANNVSALKSLIIKTADTVRSEMDAIEAELSGQYIAVSDALGTFQEDITAEIALTAANLTQEISTATKVVSNAFNAYVAETEGYIRQGIIGYEGGVPIIGIAIGQSIRTTGGTVIVGDKTYDEIDTSSSMSTWTPQRLTFFVEGLEAAYLSNGALHVGVVVVDSKIVLGQTKWHIDNINGFTIKWIGG